MNRLTGEELKEFLKEFGYNWEGLMSRPAKYPFSQEHEVYSVDLEDLISVDRKYILVNTTAIAGDIVRVPNSSVIRLIRKSPICFQIYRPTSTNQKWELDKDLSDEWVEYWALKDEAYRQHILAECKQVQKEIPESIERHKNLLAKRIAELQKETAGYIAEDNKKLEKYSQIEQIVKNAKSA